MTTNTTRVQPSRRDLAGSVPGALRDRVRRGARLLVVSCLQAASWLAAAPALAQESRPAPVATDVAAAEDLAAQAFSAYGRREYALSAALYRKAFAAAPGADLLYNLARVYDLGLHERAEAIGYYRRYLEHPSATRPRGEYATVRIDELAAALAAEAVVRRAATAPAHPEADDLVSRAEPPAPSAAESPDTWATREVVGAAVAGAGIVSLAMSAGFGLAAYAEKRAWSQDCSGNLCSSQQGVDAARRATGRANAATVALAAGGGLLAIGSALLWVRWGSEEERSGVEVALGLPDSPAGLGCSVSGRF